MIEEENAKEYRWETGYEKTWEAIKEDDDGLIDSNVLKIIQKAKKRRQEQRASQNRLGMMRHLYIILDCSESMNEQDLKPTRFLCSIKLLEMFISEFFDQNPISQLGIILLRGKRAEKITDLGGNVKKQIEIIKSITKMNLVGEPSIQNGLELAINTLKVIPTHASREILIIMSSITTCDPGDLISTIDILKNERIRCSVISLSAEIRVCRYLSRETNGTYGAALDDFHYRNLLLTHVDPPPATQSQDNSLIKMGFPYAKNEEGKDPPLTMCMCHIENADEPSKLNSGGYHCPQCFSKYCDLPVECLSCGLTLVSAPHLTRSYHHLFPVNNFKELEFAKQKEYCFACQKLFTSETDPILYQCETCMQFFCSDCDAFIHDNVHTCTGCTTLRGIISQNSHVHRDTDYLIEGDIEGYH